jgi:hypothetical protein
MINLLIVRRPLLVVAAAVLVVVTQVACGSTAPAPKTALDIRGSWDMVAVADAIRYPQTLHVADENFSTGTFAGTDVGPDQTYTLKGSISGADAIFTTTGGGYTSNATAKVSGSGIALTMAGSFTDSNQKSGIFTATRTAAGGSS